MITLNGIELHVGDPFKVRSGDIFKIMRIAPDPRYPEIRTILDL